MKKTLMALAAIVTCFSSAGAVSAETLPPLYTSFLGLDQTNAAYQYLYPGSNYEANPAFVRQMKRPYLVLGSDTSMRWQSYELMHAAGYSGSGSGGGTHDYDSLRGSVPLDLEAFFPLGTGMTLGGAAGCVYRPSSTSSTYTGWSSAGQNTTTTESSTGWSLSGSALFAMTIGDTLDIGVSAGFDGSGSPYSVAWSTDSSVAGGKAYIASPAGLYATASTSTPELAAGAVLHTGSLEVGLGLVTSYSMGSDTAWVAVDQDGDGYAESVVPVSDYYTSSSSWGAFGGPYSGFSYLDIDDALLISANPTIEWKLDSWISIIGGGSATFQIDRKVSYMRLTSGDQSGTQIDLVSPSAALFGGVSIRPTKEITLRAELGLTGTWPSQQNNSVGVSGGSIFSDGNSGHFTEVSWTSQPSNDAVISAVSTSTDSYSYSTMTYEMLFGFDWAPAPNVVIFSVGSLGLTTSSTLYSVYNPATGAVWQETSGTSRFALGYSLNVGTGVFVTRDVFVGLRAQTGSITCEGSSDGLPGSNGSTTAGGSGSYSDLCNYYYDDRFQVALFCVVTL